MNTVRENLRKFCNDLDIKFILPAADHPGMHRVYSRGKPMGDLLPAVTAIDAEISIAHKSEGAVRSVTFGKTRK